MAKLLRLSRPSRGIGNVVRTWWAMRSQKRRRERANSGAPYVPVAPVIVNTMVTDSEGVYDVTLTLSYPDAGAPIGTIEVYRNGLLVGSVATTATQFVDRAVADREVFASYKARYVNGSVVGPWSSVVDVDVVD